MSLRTQTTISSLTKLLAAPGPRPKYSRCSATIALESSTRAWPPLGISFPAMRKLRGLGFDRVANLNRSSRDSARAALDQDPSRPGQFLQTCALARVFGRSTSLLTQPLYSR